MRDAVILSAVRNPIGRYMGALKGVTAYDLAAPVSNEAMKRAKVDSTQVDEVILGQSYQSGSFPLA